MEDALEVQYTIRKDKNGIYYRNVTGPIKVVRYADDFVILAETEAQAIEAKERIAIWLKAKGLELSAEKTHITTVEQGFDFLGFTIIRRKNTQSRVGMATHTFPSKKGVTRFKSKVKELTTKGRTYPTDTIIAELNPLITGWAYYYRTGISSMTYKNLDDYTWKVMWKWARRRHPNKSKKWVKNRYYTVHRGRDWTLTSDVGVPLRQLREVKIARHTKVRGTASPDDPELEAYWIRRKQKNNSMLGVKAAVHNRQKGRCPQCEDWLDNDEELHLHHKDRNRKNWKMSNLELLHETCHYQHHYRSA